MQYRAKRWFLSVGLGVAVLWGGVPAGAGTPSADQIPDAAAALAKIEPALLFTSGEVVAVVQMSDPSLARALGPNAKKVGSTMSGRRQVAYAADLLRKQDEVVRLVQAEGGTVVGRMTRALNAVIVRVEASKLVAVAKVAKVARIQPVVDYEMDLSATVPYIGAATLQTLGFDGTGVRVAVVDSGIDYTHKNLGGPGTAPAYAAAYGVSTVDPKNTTRDGLFPTAKVVGGWDYLGEAWPNDFEAPDEDPIDFQGHGTHVADIIAGQSLDGTRVGVAPGARLYAFKACSAVSTSCSGVAMLLALEASLNPDHPEQVTGSSNPANWVVSNPVDVVNMSIGASYGQAANPIVEAVETLTAYGVVVVASAGNSSDRPYITGTPGASPSAISVAQTHTPSAQGVVVNASLSGGGTTQFRNTATVDWAPVTGILSGEVVYVGGTGCPGGPAYTTPVAGKIALIDRGACAISLKVDRAAKEGAIGVLIGLVAPGDAISFSYGGGTDMVPTVVITQADANTLKASITGGTTQVTFLPVPLVGSVVSTSSRGPSYSDQAIKPDIAAPGASVSAVAGTGTGQSAFGGTSGAAPMVAGSAALLLQAFPTAAPFEVKARLMNNAHPTLWNNPITQPGILAPITRIGAGEVRVQKAYTARTLAYEKTTKTPSLSFGYRALSRDGAPHKFTKTVEVRNLSAAACTYRPSALLRYSGSQKTGAVKVQCLPAALTVPAGGTGTFDVVVNVDPNKLPDWTLDGGLNGGNGELLRQLEYSGYVYVVCGSESVRLPWHLLPHKAADVSASPATLALGGAPGTVTLSNIKGAVAGGVDVFDLVGTSPMLPYPPPGIGDGYAVSDLKSVGVRWFSDGFNDYLQFAVTTYGDRSHPNYPAEFDILLDTDGDGRANDYLLYNAELGGFAATGQNAVYIYNLKTSQNLGAYFYTDADLNSSTAILTVPMSVLGGLTPDRAIGMIFQSYDNYFTGMLFDWIDANGTGPASEPFVPAQYTPDTPKFYTSTLAETVAKAGTRTFTVEAVPGGDVASPDHDGVLLLYRDATQGRAAQEIPVTP